MRLVDILPTFYLVGIVSILATARNQRLGDLAAGTLVVRERLGAQARRTGPARAAAGSGSETAAWDVSAITGDELAAVRRFLEQLAAAKQARGY